MNLDGYAVQLRWQGEPGDDEFVIRLRTEDEMVRSLMVLEEQRREHNRTVKEQD